ncbi:MAG: hypothetical protein R3233_08075 [Xanthomonadales bacterium]|nr:hypothetical protein [Xanthomonadales bacterium]
MNPPHVTVLAEDLARLAGAAAPDLRHPALEQAWCRGTPCRLASPSPNHLRFTLFGLEPEEALPVAALTLTADRGAPTRPDGYWLRVDPVTLWADMARVFMTRYGFADLDAYERNEIENVVRGVLLEEGFRLEGNHPERWCIPLAAPLPFPFTPLDEALGMDIGEALPEQAEARHWRRILTEVQVALHNAPVNVRRRAAGQIEINSVWFWGGGFLPAAAPSHLLDAVYSDNAVSRGLALISDCRLRPLEGLPEAGFDAADRAVLIDWGSGEPGADARMRDLESIMGRLLEQAQRGQLVLTLYDGSGEGRSYGAAARRRFWRRRHPLARMLPTASPE